MCAVLIAMIQHPERLNDLKFGLKRPIKFGIMCSGQILFFRKKERVIKSLIVIEFWIGFISQMPQHQGLWKGPMDELPTLHSERLSLKLSDVT
jgi:hypothetical protein